MKLTFCGAAGQVTGSMYLVELIDGFKILVDCGMEMSRKNDTGVEAQKIDRPFLFEPSELNMVLLTHAHLDHSGNTPNLYRFGYEGPVICTAPTAALVSLLLHDSASIHSKVLKREANDQGRKKKNGKYGKSENSDPNNIYRFLTPDVEDAISGFRTVEFNQTFKAGKTAKVTYIPAGHILGAAHILIESDENGTTKRLLFSGDVGRPDYPLHQKPESPPAADFIVCESTYGGRRMTEVADYEGTLENVIKETCVDNAGRLVIPAFSVGKTQTMLYLLHKLSIAGKIPAIKVFIDSPLAIKSTRVYEKYSSYLSDDAKELVKKYGEVFDFENLIYIDKEKASKEISNAAPPYIIVSSAGMMEGGRIQYHIKNNLENPTSTILAIGYCAEGTFGHALLQKPETIAVSGKDYKVNARIMKSDIYSAHGWKGDLENFIKNQPADKVKKVFLVHGEQEVMEEFGKELTADGYNTTVPGKGETFFL